MNDLAYIIMVPLSLVEGPVVALGAGAGMATGQLNPVFTGLILAFGALFQDTVYYWLGRWAAASPRVKALATRVRLFRNTLQPLEAAWRNALFATLLGSKFAYGLYAPMLVTAGMARAPFGRFSGPVPGDLRCDARRVVRRRLRPGARLRGAGRGTLSRPLS